MDIITNKLQVAVTKNMKTGEQNGKMIDFEEHKRIQDRK